MAGGRGTHRFDDPLLLGVALVPGGLQVRQVRRQHERLRKEAELLPAELSQQSRQVAPQTVLAAELERAGEMVELKHAHRQQSVVVFFVAVSPVSAAATTTETLRTTGADKAVTRDGVL